jgi:hypothetical protein
MGRHACPAEARVALTLPVRALLVALVILAWSALFAEVGVAAAPGPRGADAAARAGAGATAAVQRGRSCRPRSRTHRKLPCPRLRRYPTRFRAPAIPIARDGHVTTAAALEAFAATVGPLPGVRVRHDIYRRLPFATGPVEWVRYRWSALSKAQQGAVTQAIARAKASVHDRATAAESQSERMARLLSQAKAMLALHIGGISGLDIAPVVVLSEAKPGQWAFTDSTFTPSGELATCEISLRPAAVAMSDPELVGTLAHETFHCLANKFTGLSTPPVWISEGLPEWVGCLIGQEAGATRCPPAEEWWNDYLLDPQTDVVARTYDAIGFYAHLAETGHNVFDLAPKMLLNPGLAYKLVADDAFEGSWASGYRRLASLGTDWDTTGPGITKASYGPATVTIAGANGDGLDLTAKGRANLLVRLELKSEVIVVKRNGGTTSGHLRDSNGSEFGLGGGSYCTRKGGCGCPGEPASAIPKISHHALLAVTGGNHSAGTTMRVTGYSLENYCDTKPGSPTKPKPGPIAGLPKSCPASPRDFTPPSPHTVYYVFEKRILKVEMDLAQWTQALNRTYPSVSKRLRASAPWIRCAASRVRGIGAPNGDLASGRDAFAGALDHAAAVAATGQPSPFRAALDDALLAGGQLAGMAAGLDLTSG